MSLRKALEIRRTLVFRLTFWYAFVFIVSSLAAFAVFYIVIANVVRERTDQEMLRELSETVSILKSKGDDSFRTEMDFEAESEGVGNIFFRLLDPAGGEVAATDMTAWKGVGVDSDVLARVAAGGGPVLKTVAVPGKPYEARIIYGRLESGRIIEIGCSLEHDADFLGAIQDMVMPGILVVVALSTLTGWFMAARALAGIKDVTRTAVDISEGSLEKRVKVQARGEEVKQLVDAFNRMLDRIHELMKGLREVTDDIAHDLRTPITRIRGLAEAELNAGKSGEESNKLAADTVEECDNLLQMINTMLEISEIEAGIRVLSKTDVDLVQLVGEAFELFRPIADEREIRLVFHAPDHLSVRGNMHSLQRIVVNLLENAVKYTPEGGCVTVFLRDDEDAVRIIFRDTGAGISEEDLPLVFNRLYRCDSSRSQPGFGLGLCLASAVACAHGGHIAAESKLGEGSTFTVTLPR